MWSQTSFWAEVPKHPHEEAAAFSCMLFMQLFPLRVLTSALSVPTTSSCRETAANSSYAIFGCALLQPCLGLLRAPSARSRRRSSNPMARVWKTYHWPRKLTSQTASSRICACHLREEHDRRDGSLHVLVTHCYNSLLLLLLSEALRSSHIL